MDQLTGAFRPGDLVEVKSADEILATLDADGTLDHLPFMPEMVEFCGKRFRVSRRVGRMCVSGPQVWGTMREFETDDVVMLDDIATIANVLQAEALPREQIGKAAAEVLPNELRRSDV